MSYIDVDAYENAWMGLTKEDLKDVKRPLSNLTDEEKNDFHLHVIKKMRDPEYFHSLTDRRFLNTELCRLSHLGCSSDALHSAFCRAYRKFKFNWRSEIR